MTKEELLEHFATKKIISFSSKTRIAVRELTKHIPEFYSDRDRLELLIGEYTDLPTCKVCGSPVHFNPDHNKFREYCSTKCLSNDPDIIQRKKQTSIERYGVDNPAKSNTVKENMRATFIERYGVDNPAKAEGVRQKLSESNKISANKDSVKEKRKNTCKERYGVEHYLSTSDAKEKREQRYMKEFGCSHNSQKHVVHIIGQIQTKEWWNHHYINMKKTIDELSNEFEISKYILFRYARENEIELLEMRGSSLELLVSRLLDSLGIEYAKNTRKPIKPYELDFYIESKNLAIETNGLYWHTELGANKTHKLYHYEKWRKCKEMGVQLLQFTSIELETKFDIVSSMIRAKLGIFSNRIHARQLQIRRISFAEYSSFLEENHIQGSAKSSVRLGGFFDNRLVAVIGLSKTRFNKDDCHELIRFCVLRDTSIPGAFTKMLKHSGIEGQVISYSSNSYSDGSVYQKNGWQLVSSNLPGYWYTKNYIQLYHRSLFQKHKLRTKLELYNSQLSEWQNMKENGFDRYWDAGTLTWKIDV